MFPLKLLLIVRRYGPVGGMERYVWELSLHMQAMGIPVTVLCQHSYAEDASQIRVVELGDMVSRPGWIAALRFSHRVSRWLKRHPQTDTIIHSHERVNVHQVTTFHGPPFANVRDKPWWKRLSIRMAMRLYLEQRELQQATFIVPNSEIISKQLAHYYPEYAHKLTAPVVPGVQQARGYQYQQREARIVPAHGGVVGFVGKEWKRKGLLLAVNIIEELRRTRPNLRFIVIGPPVSDIKPLFAHWTGGFELSGWSQQARYPEFDVLLHPAMAEPYGMVIAEAMAARVPVVISDACGAKAQVSVTAGEVLCLQASIKDWANAVARQLNRTTQPDAFVHGWDTVAQESLAIYKQVN